MSASVVTYANKSNTVASVDPTKEVRAEDVNELKTVANNHAGLIDDATDHIANTSNPHSVTKAQVGLGNCNNTSDADKPISTATAAALLLKASSTHNHSGVYEPADAAIQTHLAATDNPHSVTKSQVGLGNVQNLDFTNPANIVQTSERRFVSDAEKATWNSRNAGNISTGTPVNAKAAIGTITITGTPVADEPFVVGAQTFTFKATRVGAGEVTISADNTTQAENIVAAITADITNVTATNTLGVVNLTAAVKGVAGNSIVLTESATGIAVSGSGTLSGGVNGTVGVADQWMRANSYFYVCIATNTITGDNWRRMSLGSAY
jgi:hypothetical protein